MNAKSIFVAMVGLGISSMGCMSQEEIDNLANDEDIGRLESAENPTGGNTQNHLESSIYHQNKYKLLTAMSYAASTGSQTQQCFPSGICMPYYPINSGVINSGLLDTSDGRDLFNVAIECALGNNVSVGRVNGGTFESYTGNAIMNTTGGWLTSALNTSQKEDVLKCVVARVNAYGVSVPIVLSGAHVTNRADQNHGGHTYLHDALWDVKITSTWNGFIYVTTINEYVWPASNNSVQAQMQDRCQISFNAASQRVCDASSSTCSFSVRNTMTNDCGYYWDTSGTVNVKDYMCSTNILYNPLRNVVQSWVADINDFKTVYLNCPLETVSSTAMSPNYVPQQ